MKNWHYALLVFLGGCCYGILSTFVKLAYAAGFTVTEVTGGQYLLGALMAWILVMFTKKKNITRQLAVKLLLSGLPFGLTGIFYYQALQTLHASFAIILLFQFVWIGSLFEWIFYKKKPTQVKLISLVILITGSILAAGVMTEHHLQVTWQGLVWGILAAFTFSTFIFLSGSVGKDTPPLLKSALLSTGGLAVVFIVFPPLYLFDLPVLMGVAPYGLLLGFFGVVLPPLLFAIGMPHVGSGLGTILTASELPVAVSMAALVLGEQVGVLRWLGVLLILAGIAVGNIKQPRVKLNAVSSRENSPSAHS
ncbi:EamA family transporter [Gracilibacillus alcaliphilus]|uniref:EamA family transporter n=1 Tax=Gracilibacillus alcaliphilus TaxID=1401441 RepID=UPI00195B5031|nr:DMT family transporter [Gracilibacillus alcaliphilus]MBM7675320.1 drug/metabolite transporter (DMT)-like permease [Gracilibacillus alcaliphilus]